MAYDIHITKRKHWTDKGSDVTLHEWDKLLVTDGELIRAEKIEGQTQNGDKFEYTLTGTKLAKWQSPSSGNIVWLVYRKGLIDISGPDDATVKKAKEIALKLGAKVQGDDGELY